MNNPFEQLNQRLSNIEHLLLEIKEKSSEEEKAENLTVKETASYLKVSEQSVHNYIKKGLFPAVKMGRVLLVKREDIEKSLKEVKSLKYCRK